MLRNSQEETSTEVNSGAAQHQSVEPTPFVNEDVEFDLLISTYSLLATKGLSTPTRNAEIQRYPKAAPIVSLLRTAQIFTDEKSQLECDLIFACKTFTLREEEWLDEFTQYYEFFRRMGDENILTPRLCEVVLDAITHKQQLIPFEATLSALRPLTARKIDTLLSATAEVMLLKEVLENVDPQHHCLHHITDQLEATRLPGLVSCLQKELRKTNYHAWFTPELFILAINNHQPLASVLKAFDALHTLGVLENFKYEVLENSNFFDNLHTLAQAGMLDINTVKHALTNESLHEAIKILSSYHIYVGIGLSAFGNAYYRTETQLLMLEELIANKALCDDIVSYEKLKQNINDPALLSFKENCHDDLLTLSHAAVPTLHELTNYRPKIALDVRVAEIKECIKEETAATPTTSPRMK